MDDILILMHKQILDVIFGFSENDFSIFEKKEPLLELWFDCKKDFKEFYRHLSPEQKIIIAKWLTSKTIYQKKDLIKSLKKYISHLKKL